MINNCTDKIISYTVQDSTYHVEATIHTWKFHDIVLAQYEIDTKERAIRLLSFNHEKEYTYLLPRLAKCLARTFRNELYYQESQKLPLTPQLINVLLDKSVEQQVKNKIILKWLKNGGDPNDTYFKEENIPASLITLFVDIEVLECFIDNGFNPEKVWYTLINEKDEKFLRCIPLAIIAVIQDRLDILELLVKKNISLDTPCDGRPWLSLSYDRLVLENGRVLFTPFFLALVSGKNEIAQFLLEHGDATNLKISPFRASSILGKALQKYSPDHKILKKLLQSGYVLASDEHLFGGCSIEIAKAYMELLISYFPINSFKMIAGGDLKILTLFFECLAKKSATLCPALEVVEGVHHYNRFIKLLGHKFGIPLSLECDWGIPFIFKSEGSSDSFLDFGKELKESAQSFFKPHPKYSSLLEDFCDTQKLTLERAQLLIERFRNNNVVSFRGKWLEHHVEFFLYGGMLFVCNRGGFREKDVQPGVQVYFFEDINKFTPELLLAIHKSSYFLLEVEQRTELGLSPYDIEQIPFEKQTGGFCEWENKILGFHLLRGLVKMIEKGDKELGDAIYEIEESHSLWVEFDKNRTVIQALEFYEKNPTLPPPISLLLFVLASHTGESQKALLDFLTKQKMTPADFLFIDNDGKTLFHYLHNTDNFEILFSLLKQIIPSIEQQNQILYQLLNPSSNEELCPLYTALSKQEHDLASTLIALGAPIGAKTQALLFSKVGAADDLSLLELYEKFGVSFFVQGEFGKFNVRVNYALEDSLGKTVLHYAIEENGNLLVEHLAPLWIKTKGDVEKYLFFAQEHGNEKAISILLELKKK